MTPLKQRNRHRPQDGVYGDCHRAALASVLDLPLDAVPHIGDGAPDGEEFGRRERAWLASVGLVPVHVLYQADLDDVLRVVKSLNPGVYYLLGGKSLTGVNHTVVALDDKIVHDPSLDDAGIVGPCEDGFYWVTYLGCASCAA